MRKIWFIDKPKGMTSFDVVRVLRNKLGIKKVGHAGTLDPLATGLMILGVGKGTKKLEKYLKLPKRYEVEIVVGESRTTGDMEGRVTEKAEVKYLDRASVKRVFREMKGKLDIAVPKYSAIKVKGEKLYHKARRGDDFEPPKREMRLLKVKVLSVKKDFKQYIVKVRMDVSSGAYIRSIAEEFGRRLGYPTVVQELRRTKIGRFRVGRGKKLEKI